MEVFILNKALRTIGSMIFPNLHTAAQHINKTTSKKKTKNLYLLKDFKNSGYIRKIHSISKNINSINSETFYITESTFYRGEKRNCINCSNKEFILIADYYTNKAMTFFNKLTLIQCDFSSPKNYNIICTKEAPFNKSSFRELEIEIASELSKLDNIKII